MEINLEQILQSDRAWEYVLLDIVKSEDLDPWDIDLVKLTETYTERINKMKTLDLRLPARLILAAAILLRLQSDHFVTQEDEEMFDEIMDELEHGASITDEEDDGDIPMLNLRIRRKPVRKVTLQDLIKTLHKSLEPKEKPEKIEKFVLELSERDITVQIKELHQQILTHYLEKIPFKELSPSDHPNDVVETLLPLLHLANEQKIDLHQEEFFKDLFVSSVKEKVE